MKKIPGFLTLLVAFSLPISFLSCNNGDEKKDDKTMTGPKPTKILLIEHKVADFTKWKAAYLAHDSSRMSAGISPFRLGRGIDDSNMVVILDLMQDLKKAKDFGASDDLKKAMKNAGVVDTPYIGFMEMVRGDTTMIPQMERLMVAHHVKDYSVWLKEFDGEGTATRASYGLMDKAIGRGMEDSNMVYVVFAVTDIAKAKARAQSPELKKMMDVAGVDSKPSAIFYRLVK